MEEPEWLVPGAKVAILTSSPRNPRVEFTTIERVLKRDVVLANDKRFTKPRLKRSLGTWSGFEELLPVDHPRVVEAVELIEFRRRWAKIRIALSDAKRHLSDARSHAELDEVIASLRLKEL